MGIFGGGLLANDNALDLLDELRSTLDAVSVLKRDLDAVFAFYERRNAGVAPRPQSAAERDEMIECFEKGALENNPHISKDFLVGLVEDFKEHTRSSFPILLDDGEEEIAKACAASLIISAVLSGETRGKLAFLSNKLNSDTFGLPITTALSTLKLILGEEEISKLFGATYKKNVGKIAADIERFIQRQENFGVGA